MKNFFKLLAPSILILVLSFLIASASGPQQQLPAEKLGEKINWLSYDVGLKKAKTENKHIFIDFTAAWCGYCKKMEREAFADSNVIRLLNNDFVPIRVDGDSQKELDIEGYKITEQNLTKSEFRVSGYPTFWFLKPDGDKLGPLRGYQRTDIMIQALTYIKDYKYDTTRADNSSQKN